jgi:heme/flavin dehydrogenase (mycofactocin system)
MSALFSHKPIETVADAQRRAKRRLPKPVYTAILAGNEQGWTVDNNISAFAELGFNPRVGNEMASERDMKTSLMGQELAMPVVISPAAAQAIHPEGEVPVARAAAKAGIAIGQSNFAVSRFEDIAAANPKAFFQLYWSGGRAVVEERVERMRRAGAKGLIITLDATASQPRDWGSPTIPERIDLQAAIKFAPMALSRPRWLASFLKGGGIPDLKVPNLAKSDDVAPTMIEGFMDWMGTAMPTWDDITWLSGIWDGPFMVKGILHPDDARRAVDAGATAIGVSNHGGNNLDTTPSPLRYLPGVLDAVGDEVEVTFDSGIRRGADVVKVLALGAKAALIGRSWFFGLAADGERGVSEVLDAYRLSIDRTLIGLGKSSIHELTPDDIIVPDGYFLEHTEPLPMGQR